jgi:hypothetical protein
VTVRYRSPDEDSERWQGFPFRSGDVVISTRSKSGTTWMQMICLLLVLRTPELPRPLAELSPWLDWLVEPREQVLARLAAQRHRRVIKTHTPLDGVPIDPRATYVVVGRHPLDMAVSLWHQGGNIDRERVRTLAGQPPPERPRPERPPLAEAVRRWIDKDADPRAELDSLPGVLWHLSDAWRRRDEPNVELVHYHDLSSDLGGQMRRLAARLDLAAPTPELVAAAGFDRMRARAEQLAPDTQGVLKDRAAFFRRGRSGAGGEELGEQDVARYLARAAELAPPDLLAWLHRPAAGPVPSGS